MDINQKNKNVSILVSILLLNLIYLVCSYFYFGNLRLLPLNVFEENLSQVNLAVWPYITIQSLTYYSLILDTDTVYIKRWIVGSFIFGIFASIIYQVFPSYYPSQNTIGLDMNDLSQKMLYALRVYGTENSSFPAYFMGIAFIAAISKLIRKPQIGVPYLLTVLMIGYCGLLIKQLYFSAIIASLILAIIISIITSKLIKN